MARSWFSKQIAFLGSAILLAVKIFDSAVCAQAPSEADQGYMDRFVIDYPKIDPAPALDQYATPALYDQRFMGQSLDDLLAGLEKDASSLAWGGAYRIFSLNEMFRATGDVKYLQAAYRCVQAVMALRDDVRQTPLWTGEVAPVWGTGKYHPRGWTVYPVHTGVISAAILDFLACARASSAMASELAEADIDIYVKIQQSLDFHDRQWKDGPGDQEGYYVYQDQDAELDGQPLAANRLSAMGRALWFSWKLGGNPHHCGRALAVGRYLKRRLPVTESGAFVWPYQLSRRSVNGALRSLNSIGGGESISNGAITAAFPIMLAGDGEIFDVQDMERFSQTVFQGFARLDNGVLFGQLGGLPTASTKGIQGCSLWLYLTPYAPRVYGKISDFYLHHDPNPGPLDMALLIRYRGR